MYVFHTSRNRHEFFFSFPPILFLEYSIVFSVNNLAESKSFLLPNLSNVPTNILLFPPLVSRYVHQQCYCNSYLYHDRYPYNIPLSTINVTRCPQIIFLFLPPILQKVPKLYYCFYYQYYERYTHRTPVSTTCIIRVTHIILLFLQTVS